MNEVKSTPRGTTEKVSAADPANLPEGFDKKAFRLGLRIERYYTAAALRATARRLTIHESVRKCGMVNRRAAGVGVVAALGDPEGGRIGGFRGLCSCSNVWSCTRCGGVIGAKRAEEIQHCMEEWREHGATMQEFSMVPVRDGFGCFEDPRYPGQPFSGEDPWDWGIEDPDNAGRYISGPRRKEGGVELGLKPRMERKGRDVVHAPGEVLFGTLTIRHQKATKKQQAAGVTKWDLDELWGAVRKAYERFTQDRYWKGNIPASIVTVEQTYSKKTGWHVHLHLMLFVSKEFAADVVELGRGLKEREKSCTDCKAGKKCANAELIARSERDKTTVLKQKWVDAVSKDPRGYTATLAGQHFRVASDEDVATLAQYVTKNTRWSVADEMTKWNEKKAKGVSVNMHEVVLFLHHAYQVQAAKPRRLSQSSSSQSERIVARFRAEKKTAEGGKSVSSGLSRIDNEIADYEELYREYEAASKGKRMHTWSWGMRAAFGLDDVSDQELTDANDDADPIDDLDQGTEEIAGFANGKSWFKFASRWQGPVEMKALVETGSGDTVMDRLREYAEEKGLPLTYGDEWRSHVRSHEEEEYEANAFFRYERQG